MHNQLNNSSDMYAMTIDVSMILCSR